jgi:hypothetical protein
LTDALDQLEPDAAKLLSALRASGAPRFLMNLVSPPEGNYEIAIDCDTLDPDDRTGQLSVWTDGDGHRCAYLSYAHRFSSTAERAEEMSPVYTHIDVARGGSDRRPVLRIRQSVEPEYPDTWSETCEFRDLANEISIADFCDFNSLPTSSASIGQDAPAPMVEEH